MREVKWRVGGAEVSGWGVRGLRLLRATARWASWRSSAPQFRSGRGWLSGPGPGARAKSHSWGAGSFWRTEHIASSRWVGGRRFAPGATEPTAGKLRVTVYLPARWQS